MFGRVDSVLLWHAYPRLGFDSRTQFDFYREMPGGHRRGSAAEVTDVLHARGIRVFVDYNPWDAGTLRRARARSSHALDADGVMLDTMTDVPRALARAVARAEAAASSSRPSCGRATRTCGTLRQSWAQWFDVGDARDAVDLPASLARPAAQAARHPAVGHVAQNGHRLQLLQRLGAHPLGQRLRHVEPLFARGPAAHRRDRRRSSTATRTSSSTATWLPLIPTGVPGLDANRWSGARGRATRGSVTLRNRTSERAARTRVPPMPARPGSRTSRSGATAARLARRETRWRSSRRASRRWCSTSPRGRGEALEHFRSPLPARRRRAGRDYDERCPRPARGRGGSAALRARRDDGGAAAHMIEMPGGTFDMRIRHERRECGCYPVRRHRRRDVGLVLQGRRDARPSRRR